jgi:hypothetical protein
MPPIVPTTSRFTPTFFDILRSNPARPRALTRFRKPPGKWVATRPFLPGFSETADLTLAAQPVTRARPNRYGDPGPVVTSAHGSPANFIQLSLPEPHGDDEPGSSAVGVGVGIGICVRDRRSRCRMRLQPRYRYLSRCPVVKLEPALRGARWFRPRDEVGQRTTIKHRPTSGPGEASMSTKTRFGSVNRAHTRSPCLRSRRRCWYRRRGSHQTGLFHPTRGHLA